MKAFAVFTRHEPAEITWAERGYVFVNTPDGRTMFAGMESPAGGVVCLRLKCGGALADLAASRATELGGFVHAFDNGRPDFPEDAEAYDALAAHERRLALPVVAKPIPWNSTSPRPSQAEIERDAMHADLQRAKTLNDLHALYVDWIGLGALDEDLTDTGDTDADELRGILADHIREFCFAAGVQCPAFH